MHRTILPRLLGSLLLGRLRPEELMREAEAILARAEDLPGLHKLITAAAKRWR